MNEDKDDLPEYWLRAGDRLFLQDGGGYDAAIAESPAERSYRMKKAFKDAADLLATHIEEDRHDRRNTIWPIVFCYRQYIELALKDAIAKHGRSIDPPISSNWRKLKVGHRLVPLWVFYKKITAETLVDTALDEIPEIAAIEACIHEFDTIDDGYSFRFPTDSEGNHIDIPITSIDLPRFQRTMECVYTFLDANESVLDLFFDGRS